MKTAKKAISVILSVILWIIILLAALFTFTTLATRDRKNVSSLAGFTPMSVQTDSRSPTFNSGAMIIIKKCDTSKLKEGDIIKSKDSGFALYDEGEWTGNLATLEPGEAYMLYTTAPSTELEHPS